MKSGVQLNFIERRALADRALSRLVQIARDETAAMTSREQRGVYQLESATVERSGVMLRAKLVWIDPIWVGRWRVFVTFVVAFARDLRVRKWPEIRQWATRHLSQRGLARHSARRSDRRRVE